MDDIKEDLVGKARALRPRLEEVEHHRPRHKKVEEQRSRLLKAIEITREAINITSADGKIIYTNNSMDKLFGYEKGELLGKSPLVLNAGPAPEKVMRKIMDTIRKKGFWEGQINNKSKNGAEFISYARISAVKGKDGKILNFISTQHDITEHKKAEKKLLDYQVQLKALAWELLQTEERQKQRLAAVLHDHINQNLVMAKLTLQLLKESTSDSDMSASLGKLCATIDQTIQGSRILTFELHNPVLHELGFEAAVEQWLTEQIQRRYGIKCKFTTETQPLDPDHQIGIILFQAVRELLVNVVRHARARAVRVSIQKAGDEIQVTVEDDGVGFLSSRLDLSLSQGERGGFGLFNIQERLEYLGGNLKVKSAPGHGTCVALTAPLKWQNNTLNVGRH